MMYEARAAEKARVDHAMARSDRVERYMVTVGRSRGELGVRGNRIEYRRAKYNRRCLLYKSVFHLVNHRRNAIDLPQRLAISVSTSHKAHDNRN
jgi:hypothetical protein